MEPKDFDKIFKAIGNLQHLPEGVKWSPEKGWKDYENSYRQRRKFSKRYIVLFSTAASILLLVGIGIYIIKTNQYNVIEKFNDTRSAVKFELPDKNSVWLNTNSGIEYSKGPGKNLSLIHI